MKIKKLDKLIRPLGKYGYLIVGSLSMIITGYFIFLAVLYMIFTLGLTAFVFMFVVSYCWHKDTERVKKDGNIL